MVSTKFSTYDTSRLKVYVTAGNLELSVLFVKGEPESCHARGF